jgi:hypothetical protein
MAAALKLLQKMPIIEAGGDIKQFCEGVIPAAGLEEYLFQR